MAKRSTPPTPPSRPTPSTPPSSPSLASGRKPRSAHEEQLLETAARLLPAGTRNPTMSREHAMIVAGARGARIRDVSGNEYIDYLLGSGPMLLGHAHPAVVAAVRERLEDGSSYLLVSEPAVRLAEKLVERVPCAERVSLCNSGSEAVAYALRLARAHRCRDRILKFEGGYHGQYDPVLMSNQWTWQPAELPQAVPNSLGIPATVRDEVLVAPYNDAEAAAELIDRHHDELGAVIVEPMQRTFPPRPGFLEAVREATERHEVPLIFDEVVTGFRLGLGGGQALYGVTPDLCALGKSISAGHPIGVVCGSAAIMEHAEAVRQVTGGYVSITGTYSGNPISCAAALASIEVLSQPGVYDRLFALGSRLREGLGELLAGAGIPAHLTGEAPAFQVWFGETEPFDHRSAIACDVMRSMQFTAGLLERGVMKAHEKFFISTAHSDEDIEFTLAAAAEVIVGMAGTARTTNTPGA